MRNKSIFMLATLMLVLAVFISACGGNNTGNNPASTSGDKQESASTGETRSFKTVKGVIDEKATFGLYELTDKNALWIFGDNAGRGGQAVYNALKLNMPKKTANSKEQTIQLSMEVLPQYDADYMFLTTYDPDKKGTALKQLKSSAVWGNLPAVKNNKVFFNDFDTYYRYDPIAITGQIDMVVDMLVEREKENKAKK
ncbi:hypothetical protein C1I59_04070 [Paenibacillus polymyxa]|uniref:ABC transporter substrate-binding protein n=1 Tax=Paenibacillus polymyxa TaxID=1406 RepID=UPI0010BEB140|nr:ABC transporter substrate-binding protein [Paenibacillus polymyxa]TKH38473.1 hypothetical protein C1I59_04070 [Paenibacillus polymyxa]